MYKMQVKCFSNAFSEMTSLDICKKMLHKMPHFSVRDAVIFLHTEKETLEVDRFLLLLTSDKNYLCIFTDGRILR